MHTVTDCLHGTIPLTLLERQILANPGFNRLHDILQNSALYLTFPGSRTSRLAHSLGVMHIASQIFANGLFNSNKETREKFVKKVQSWVEKRINTVEKQGELRSLYRKAGLEDTGLDGILKELSSWLPPSPIYSALTPADLPKETLGVAAIAWQATRIAAMLHDLGHPPFSHVAESALHEVRDAIRKSEKVTDRQKQFLEVIDEPVKGEDKNLPIHEAVTRRISRHLLRQVLDTMTVRYPPLKLKDGAKQQWVLRNAFFLLSADLANAILCDTRGVPRHLHQIIAGDMDADRLDYVERDRIACGLQTAGRLEIQRILLGIRLVLDRKVFKFLPDVRALSAIEAFFGARWELWKYAINHHRAVKMNALLRRCLTVLLKRNLGEKESSEKIANLKPQETQSGVTEDQNGNSSDSISHTVLPLDISALWSVLRERGSDDAFLQLVTQWEDSWLMTMMRYEARIYIANNPNDRPLFDELLGFNKHFFSVVKRLDDFHVIGEGVRDTIIGVIKEKAGESHVGTPRRRSSFEEIMKGIEMILARMPDAPDLYVVRLIFAIMSADKGRGDKIFRDCVTRAIIDCCDKKKLSHVLVEHIAISTGLGEQDSFDDVDTTSPGNDEPFLLQLGGLVLPISSVSVIEKELKRRRQSVPLFYIYGIVESPDFNCNDLRKALAKAMRKELTKGLTELMAGAPQKSTPAV